MSSATDGLKAILPAHVHVSTDAAERVAYARDYWPRHLIDVRAGKVGGSLPAGIVWPTTTEEVATIVAWCAKEGVPLVPYGAGSGVCGGVLPEARTVVVDLKRMKRWRKLDAEASTLDVEAGAMGITLEEDLQAGGHTIGHFPSSILCSTVGGWIAARGAGQCSGKYGKVEDMVVGVELVDGRGEVRTLHRRRSDFDLIPFVVGSEGTLGVITSATMRLHPAPVSRGFVSFSAPTTEHGWELMRALFQAGLRPAVARLYDPFDAALARRGSVKGAAKSGSANATKVGDIGAGGAVLRSILKAPRALNGLIDLMEEMLPGETFGAMLVLIFEGNGDETRDGVQRAKAIARAHGVEDLGEGPARTWLSHRYSVSYRLPPTVRAGAFVDTIEVASTWSKLRGLYDGVRRALGRYAFVMAHLSHAYPDGCSIYFSFAGVGGDEADTRANYDAAWRAAMEAAVEAGGTLSHHHGVGRSKAPRMGLELGVGVDVVRALHRAFDPRGILNPGNLIPSRPEDEGYVARYEGADRSRIPASIAIDEISGLASAPASATIEAIEAAARSKGHTLAIDGTTDRSTTLRAWLDAGTPGAIETWTDPVDHVVAGVLSTLPDGRLLEVRGCPRRASGPDLMALSIGARGRFGAIEGATLRTHRLDADRATTSKTSFDRDPKPNDGEAALAGHLEAALRRSS